MKPKVLTILMATLTGLATLAFNNCSDVEFSDVPADVVQSSPNVPGSDLSNQEEQEILDRLPPEEVLNPRPITDLIDHPELFDLYRCPDSDGVVICHFPDNVEAQHTQCVGRPAVPTHYDHVREYSLDGSANKTIQDYLGPCRVAL
jgi:hypothetical protein